MIHVILADAEIELVRIEARDEVLDAREHVRLIVGRPDSDRRGRPDIVYDSLRILLADDHFRDGELSVTVHTIHDEVLVFDYGASAPEDYTTFKQVLAEILSSPEGKNRRGWRRVANRSLDRLVRDLGADATILLSPKGEEIPLTALLNELHHLDIVIIVGAFPEGDFRSDAYSIAHHVVSLGEEEMTVPSVIREVLGALEH